MFNFVIIAQWRCPGVAFLDRIFHAHRKRAGMAKGYYLFLVAVLRFFLQIKNSA